jgi:hypothetical protein
MPAQNACMHACALRRACARRFRPLPHLSAALCTRAQRALNACACMCTRCRDCERVVAVSVTLLHCPDDNSANMHTCIRVRFNMHLPDISAASTHSYTQAQAPMLTSMISAQPARPPADRIDSIDDDALGTVACKCTLCVSLAFRYACSTLSTRTRRTCTTPSWHCEGVKMRACKRMLALHRIESCAERMQALRTHSHMPACMICHIRMCLHTEFMNLPTQMSPGHAWAASVVAKETSCK